MLVVPSFSCTRIYWDIVITARRLDEERKVIREKWHKCIYMVFAQWAHNLKKKTSTMSLFAIIYDIFESKLSGSSMAVLVILHRLFKTSVFPGISRSSIVLYLGITQCLSRL